MAQIKTVTKIIKKTQLPKMTEEKQKTRKQHYVPQFYLKQWGDDSGCFYPIQIESKLPPKLTVFNRKSAPSRFCYENFFYAQKTGKEDEISQVIENSFAEVEGIFSKELPKLEKKILGNEQITELDKHHLSEFMVFMWLKGKLHRQWSQRLMEDVMKDLNKHYMVRYINTNPEVEADMKELGVTKQQMIEFIEKGEYSIDFGNTRHLRLMEKAHGFCNLLRNKFWRVLISRKGEFITTDAPYLDMALSNKWFGNDFLSREQTFILSPRVLVVASFPKNMEGKRFVRKDITSNRQLIQSVNSHSLMNSIMFGFHNDKSLLEELSRFISAIHMIKEKGIVLS